MKAIEVINITKYYGNVLALDSVSISVEKGELFGVIGPDGAGKTSLFEILVTLQTASQGDTFVDGLNCQKEYKDIRKIIGYMPGRFSLYQDLSVRENLNFFAEIFGSSIEDGRELIEDIWVQIEPFSSRKAGKLSGGMKQKLALCCALVHKPKVLFLDEPTTGVDPVSRKEFWQMLKRLKAKGITIFVSTPYMDEAVLCDRVALIQNGKILQTDSPENITNNFDKTVYKIKANDAHSLLNVFKNWDKVHSCYAFGQSVHLILLDMQSASKDIINYLEQQGVKGAKVEKILPTIEDCFIELMTRQNGKNN